MWVMAALPGCRPAGPVLRSRDRAEGGQGQRPPNDSASVARTARLAVFPVIVMAGSR